MPTQEQLEARKAIHDLEQNPKHTRPDKVAAEQTRDDDLNDPKNHAKSRKTAGGWKEIPGGGGFSHPDHDE
jgi:hypothetical protein